MAARVTSSRNGSSRGKGQIKWDDDHRLVLHLLVCELGESKRTVTDQAAAIFSSIFETHLQECGVSGGVSKNVLTSQYREKSRGKSKLWSAFRDIPDGPKETAVWDALRSRIRALAGDLQNNSQAPNSADGMPDSHLSHSMPGRSTAKILLQQFQNQLPDASIAARKSPRSRTVTCRSLPSPINHNRSTSTSQYESSPEEPNLPTQRVTRSFAEYYYATPTTTSTTSNTATLGKRKYDLTIEDENDASSDDESDTGTVKRRKADQTEATDFEPRTPQFPRTTQHGALSLQCSTLMRSPRSCRTGLVIPKRFPDGSTVYVGERTHLNMQLPQQKVTRAEAHPPVGLLYRFFRERPNQALNSRDGFVARKYCQSRVFPDKYQCPTNLSVDPCDIKAHINKDLVLTPYISTTSSLAWLLRRVVKEALHEGDSEMRVSVIDRQALGNRVFWALPYHRSIKKKFVPYTGGAWSYPATFEHLVWRDVPRNAIIRTINVSDLRELGERVPAVGRALRLEALNAGNEEKVKEALKANQTLLDYNIASAIAQICLFFGVDAGSSFDHISHMVYELVSGWYLQISQNDDAGWLGLADAFSRELCKGSSGSADDFERQQHIKHAFLDGVYWSCGGDVKNPKFLAKDMTRVNRGAVSVGLQSPAAIVAGGLRRLMQRIVDREENAQKALQNRLARLTLPAREDNGEMGHDGGSDGDEKT